MAALRVEITTASRCSAACAKKRFSVAAESDAHIKDSVIYSFSVSKACKFA
jgi:hypothetical protein